MNIIYHNKSELSIVRECDIKVYELAVFFSSHKYLDIFVLSDNEVLLGYVNDITFKTSIRRKVSPVRFFPECVFSHMAHTVCIEELFRDNPNLNSVPVTDESGHLVGAYVKSIPEELMSYDRLLRQMAMNVLPMFSKEFLSKTNALGNENVCVLASEKDYLFMKRLFPSFLKYDPFRITHGKKVTLIDILFSKSYRKWFCLQSKDVEVVTLEELLSTVLIDIVREYVQSRGGQIFYIEGPLKEKLKGAKEKWPQLFSGINLSEALNNPVIREAFYGNNDLSKWALDEHDGVLSGIPVWTNGMNLVMQDVIQTDDIEDKQLYNDNTNYVYLFGSCLAYGACVQRDQTISVYLNNIIHKSLSKYIVVNKGVKNGHSALNDLLYILSTPIRRGDIIVVLNHFEGMVKELIIKHHGLYESSDYFNMDYKQSWNFLDNTFHANASVNMTLATYIYSVIGENLQGGGMKGTSLYSHNYFVSSGKMKLSNPSWVLENELMLSYINYLEAHKKKLNKSEKAGAVILTANPFTKGHEYLINKAREQCDILYVFIVEEDRFFFSTSQREQMVRRVVRASNVVILSTGRIMTTPMTFPDYFKKNRQQNNPEIIKIPTLHFQIFGAIVAPLLEISIRFVGAEPNDIVTEAYNSKLRELLPAYGIRVVEFPRAMTPSGIIVSASKAREMIKENRFNELNDHLLPQTIKQICKWMKKN